MSSANLPPAIGPRTFTNPISHETIGDPWVVYHEGFYYLTGTFDARTLRVYKSPTLSNWEFAEKTVVWTAPDSGPQSRQVWAPELHRVGDRWFVYYTASDGIDAHHRHYVLESLGSDPLGPYQDRGRVDPAWESYAIDGSLLTMPDGRHYFMYAASGLHIAPMESPTRVSGPGVVFACGEHDWEHGWEEDGTAWRKSEGFWIEAPTALWHDGTLFVVYSAGHTATEHYYLGLLRLDGDDPLNPAAWTKFPEPVFGPYTGTDGEALSPGHNGFTKSPDGTENWIVYHARDPDGHGGMGERTARAQRFTWKPNGTPDFGHPIPSGVPIEVPSGELPGREIVWKEKR
jgi:GH43 family beta-xylosidase